MFRHFSPTFPISHCLIRKLRNIWLGFIDDAVNECDSPTSVKPPPRESLLSPAKPILPLRPRKSFNSRCKQTATNSFSSFLSKNLNTNTQECLIDSPDAGGVRVDILNWLGRATLDVIGLAGFGYSFNALVDDENILATAFAEVFSAARKFRFITVLQAWFPILYFLVRPL